MKIVLLGNFTSPFSTECEWAWTYEKLGHQVIRMQENRATTDQILQEAQSADLFHYVHTHGWVTPGSFSIKDILDILKQKGVPTVSVHLDYWRGLVREKDVGTHPFWDSDFVFTADGGSNEWYRSKGINHYYLKAGVVERDCHLGTPQDKFKHDVIFVGSKGYHPEWPYRPQLIDWLAKTYGERFYHYGGDGYNRSRISGQDLNDLYASAKVVIGDTLCLNFDHPDYFSDRLFETTGRGGFLIFPYIRGVEECFELGKELIVYRFGNLDSNALSLKAHIDYFIQHDEQREAIRIAGHERTKRDHTYTNRALEMLDIVKTNYKK